MIIWSGQGYLVAVIVFGMSLLFNLLINHWSGGTTYWNENKWPFGVSLLVSAVICWFLGKHLAKRGSRTVIDVKTNQEVVPRSIPDDFII